MLPSQKRSRRLELLSGVRPIKQERSLAKRQDLMAAGLQLLQSESFDQMTIGRIAGAAGCSVGTFYERFMDKDSFLIALQEDYFWDQIEQARSTLDPERWAEKPNDEVVCSALEHVVESFCGDAEGLLRASLIQSANKPHIWEPAKRSGAELVKIVVRLLEPRLNRNDAEAVIRIALQLLYGTLVNMILHDPGPLRLNSKLSRRRLVEHISSMLH